MEIEEEQRYPEQEGDQGMTLEITENPVQYSSQALGQYLIQLKKYHTKWSELRLADDITDHSLDLLEEIQNQVLITKPFVDKMYKSNAIELEIMEIVQATGTLKDTLMDIDQSILLSGEIPFDVTDDIEQCFSDITYYLAKYLLLLSSLDSSQTNAHWVQ
jgi:Mg2+ and Co2+ transporter CorA